MLSRIVTLTLCMMVCTAFHGQRAEGSMPDGSGRLDPRDAAGMSFHQQSIGVTPDSGRSRIDFLLAFEESLQGREVELDELERRLLLSQRKLDDKIRVLSRVSGWGMTFIPSRIWPVLCAVLGFVCFVAGMVAGKGWRLWRRGRTSPTRSGGEAGGDPGARSREERIDWSRLPGVREPRPSVFVDPRTEGSSDNRWQMVKALSAKGFSPLMIARHLEMGVGEVQLVLNLIRSVDGNEKNEAVFHPSHS